MLLDTHVWVAAALDDRRQLGPRVRHLLERAAARGRLHLSTLSIFELTSLHLTGRIRLAMPIETWIRESIERSTLRLSEVTVSIAIDAGSIPGTALSDPFDRLLVASARQLDIPLVTRDRRILDYARITRQVRVVEAGR